MCSGTFVDVRDMFRSRLAAGVFFVLASFGVAAGASDPPLVAVVKNEGEPPLWRRS